MNKKSLISVLLIGATALGGMILKADGGSTLGQLRASILSTFEYQASDSVVTGHSQLAADFVSPPAGPTPLEEGGFSGWENVNTISEPTSALSEFIAPFFTGESSSLFTVSDQEEQTAGEVISDSYSDLKYGDWGVGISLPIHLGLGAGLNLGLGATYNTCDSTVSQEAQRAATVEECMKKITKVCTFCDPARPGGEPQECKPEDLEELSNEEKRAYCEELYGDAIASIPQVCATKNTQSTESIQEKIEKNDQQQSSTTETPATVDGGSTSPATQTGGGSTASTIPRGYTSVVEQGDDPRDVQPDENGNIPLTATLQVDTTRAFGKNIDLKDLTPGIIAQREHELLTVDVTITPFDQDDAKHENKIKQKTDYRRDQGLGESGIEMVTFIHNPQLEDPKRDFNSVDASYNINKYTLNGAVKTHAQPYKFTLQIDPEKFAPGVIYFEVGPGAHGEMVLLPLEVGTGENMELPHEKEAREQANEIEEVVVTAPRRNDSGERLPSPVTTGDDLKLKTIPIGPIDVLIKNYNAPSVGYKTDFDSNLPPVITLDFIKQPARIVETSAGTEYISYAFININDPDSDTVTISSKNQFQVDIVGEKLPVTVSVPFSMGINIHRQLGSDKIPTISITAADSDYNIATENYEFSREVLNDLFSAKSNESEVKAATTAAPTVTYTQGGVRETNYTTYTVYRGFLDFADADSKKVNVKLVKTNAVSSIWGDGPFEFTVPYKLPLTITRDLREDNYNPEKANPYVTVLVSDDQGNETYQTYVFTQEFIDNAFKKLNVQTK